MSAEQAQPETSNSRRRETPPGDKSPLGLWETADERWEAEEKAAREATDDVARQRADRRARYWFAKAERLWAQLPTSPLGWLVALGAGVIGFLAGFIFIAIMGSWLG
jgi:hypothetical protein